MTSAAGPAEGVIDVAILASLRLTILSAAHPLFWFLPSQVFADAAGQGGSCGDGTGCCWLKPPTRAGTSSGPQGSAALGERRRSSSAEGRHYRPPPCGPLKQRCRGPQTCLWGGSGLPGSDPHGGGRADVDGAEEGTALTGLAMRPTWPRICGGRSFREPQPGHEGEPGIGIPTSQQQMGDIISGTTSSSSSSKHPSAPALVGAADERRPGAQRPPRPSLRLSCSTWARGSSSGASTPPSASGWTPTSRWPTPRGRPCARPAWPWTRAPPAALAKLYPPLAQVRVCLIVDAAIGFAAAARVAVGRLLAPCWPFQRLRWAAMHPAPLPVQ